MITGQFTNGGMALMLIVGGLASASQAQLNMKLEFTVEWDRPVLTSGVNTGAVYARADPGYEYQIWCFAPCNGKGGMFVDTQAFASTFFALLNLENGQTGQLIWSVPAEFSAPNQPGEPDGNGGMMGARMGQIGKPNNPDPNMNNMVKILDLEWDPQGDFTPRFVNYQAQATTARVYAEVGLAAWLAESVTEVNLTGGFIVDSECYPDCDGSGSLNVDDFICFQTQFAVGDPLADCDGSGSLDIDDFVCFQTLFAMGC